MSESIEPPLSQHSPEKHCSFLTLPFDVRHLIYTAIFDDVEVICYPVRRLPLIVPFVREKASPGYNKQWPFSLAKHGLGLGFTCNSITKEFFKAAYHELTFTLLASEENIPELLILRYYDFWGREPWFTKIQNLKFFVELQNSTTTSIPQLDEYLPSVLKPQRKYLEMVLHPPCTVQWTDLSIFYKEFLFLEWKNLQGEDFMEFILKMEVFSVIVELPIPGQYSHGNSDPQSLTLL